MMPGRILSLSMMSKSMHGHCLGIGEVLVLTYGVCDDPFSLKHVRCKECVDRRVKIATEAHQRAIGCSKERWPTLFLCRIHTE
jgi:hypothetical protein